MERKCRLMVIGIWICLGLPLIVSEATAQIRISKSSLTIDEGGKGFYKVHLDVQPSGETTLDIATTNSDVRVNPETLTFTPDDWGTEPGRSRSRRFGMPMRRMTALS